MKISYNWLKDYLDFNLDAEQAAEKLTLAGLEVEEVHSRGTTFEGIVAGEVLSCEKHPNADKLSVCQVDTGDQKLSIVCGAPNVAAGQKVLVARIGAELPVSSGEDKAFIIRKTKLRGVVSEGMICAEDELGLGHDHSGIMVLEPSVRAGTPASELFTPTRDYVFEIGLTPNRPDASSHTGVARDLGAVLEKPLSNPLSRYDSQSDISDISDYISVKIANPEKCYRYAAMVVEDIRIKESPAWLKTKLESIGLRPVNNVVDVTNFVLHETGQPLHAFDLKQIAGKQIIVQDYDHEVNFTTLDEIERKIPAGSLFICDGEKPVAIAGVMGGFNSEIGAGTRSVLIESACFDPVSIRKTSKLLGLQTDSSYRFERGVDPNMAAKAARRCAALIGELAGGRIIDGVTDVYPAPVRPLEIRLRMDRLNRVLGSAISTDEAAGILNRLEIDTTVTSAGTGGEGDGDGSELACRVPTFRPDIREEVDLIEEVARIYDYNRIPDPEYLKLKGLQPLPFHEKFREKIRSAAGSLGLMEIYTNSLLPEPDGEIQAAHKTREAVSSDSGFSEPGDEVIPTLNPITKDQAVLRHRLLYGFLGSAAHNFRRDAAGVRFFEIGNVFAQSSGGSWIPGIREETHLLLGLAGNKREEHWLSKSESYSFFDIRALTDALFESLGLKHRIRYEKSGDDRLILYGQIPKSDVPQEDRRNRGSQEAEHRHGITADGNEILIGELAAVPAAQLKDAGLEVRAFTAEISISRLEVLAENLSSARYHPVPRFPSFEYDIALVVDKQTASGDLERLIRESAGKKLQSIDIFDVFEGGSLEKDKKSIAFRLRFLDDSKTLTISDVDPIIKKTVKQLNRKFSATLRS